MCTYTRSDQENGVNDYTATYKIDEFPIYGSDRIGVYKDSAANVLFTTDYTSLTDLPEYWRSTSTPSAVSISNSAIAFSSVSFSPSTSPTSFSQVGIPNAVVERFNSASATQQNLNQSIVQYDNLALCSDAAGNTLAMAFNAKNLSGNKKSNSLIVTDAQGVPYSSTADLKGDPRSQNLFAKIPGEERYYLFTIDSDGKAYYHIIDAINKSILQKNTPIDNQDGYAFCLTAIVDEIGNGSSQVFLKQSKNDSSSIYAFSFDNNGITGKRLIDKVPSNDKAAVSAMVLSNDASQLAVVVDKSKPRFLFRSPKNCELRIYDINSSYDSIALSDSLVFNQNYISSLAYSQNNTYLYFQKQDMQGNAVLHRYNLNSQSSEAITAVTAQGKLRYADSLLYIMHDSKIEVLENTDTEDIAALNKSTISAQGSFRYSGISSSSAIGMHGSLTYGYSGNTYYRCLAKQYELKDHLGNVRVVISDVKEPNATYDQFTATLQSYANYYAFGMLQPNRHYTLAEEYKFGFQGQERDDEIKGEGNAINYKYRIHDPRLGRFFAIDPLFRKYPYNSQYAFSENRVVDGVEWEGLEVILFHPDDKHFLLYSCPTDYKDNPFVIDIYSHGSEFNINDESDGGKTEIKTGEQLDEILIEKEAKWRNRKSGAPMIVVLHGCSTGKSIDGKPSFAENVSASKKFKNVLVIAPSKDTWTSSTEGDLGPSDDPNENSNPEDGVWNIFWNGELIGTLPKESIPNNSGKGEDIDFEELYNSSTKSTE